MEICEVILHTNGGKDYLFNGAYYPVKGNEVLSAYYGVNSYCKDKIAEQFYRTASFFNNQYKTPLFHYVTSFTSETAPTAEKALELTDKIFAPIMENHLAGFSYSRILIYILKYGIIVIKKVMPVNIEIDQLTPCLERMKDSKIVETSFSAVSKSELMNLNRWLFKWTDSDLTNCEIYKLTVNDDERIQGLIAIQIMQCDKAVYVNIAESAPHNKYDAKEYIGVGGHLFAIAVQRSYELGFDGFVYFDAKNISLVSHYARSLGAILIGHPHPYRMIIDDEAARKLIQIYNFGRD